MVMFQNVPNEFILNLETALFNGNQFIPSLETALFNGNQFIPSLETALFSGNQMCKMPSSTKFPLLPANLFDAWL